MCVAVDVNTSTGEVKIMIGTKIDKTWKTKMVDFFSMTSMNDCSDGRNVVDGMEIWGILQGRDHCTSP